MHEDLITETQLVEAGFYETDIRAALPVEPDRTADGSCYWMIEDIGAFVGGIG
jgi:hypothetical protein